RCVILAGSRSPVEAASAQPGRQARSEAKLSHPAEDDLVEPVIGAVLQNGFPPETIDVLLGHVAISAVGQESALTYPSTACHSDSPIGIQAGEKMGTENRGALEPEGLEHEASGNTGSSLEPSQGRPEAVEAHPATSVLDAGLYAAQHPLEVARLAGWLKILSLLEPEVPQPFGTRITRRIPDGRLIDLRPDRQ